MENLIYWVFTVAIGYMAWLGKNQVKLNRDMAVFKERLDTVSKLDEKIEKLTSALMDMQLTIVELTTEIRKK